VKTRFKTALVTFTLILFSIRASGQVSSTQVDAIFSSLRSSKAPGAAVLVVRDGRPVFGRGYGVTDQRTLRPIDANTNFRLASFTKQFTAAAIMLLARDGKLHYDDHLTDFFPEFPAYGKSISIRNLLNHTSGLPDYEDILMKHYPDTPPEESSADSRRGRAEAARAANQRQVCARLEVGVQQLGICRVGDDRGESLGQELRPVSSGENIRATENEKHAGLREGQKRSAAPRIWPQQT